MRLWNLYVQISESRWGVFAGNQQARTSLVIPLVGQNHWIFLISAGPPPPPPQKKTNISEKKHLNTLKTMRTGCEVSQRLGRERELADNSLDRMEKEQSKTKIEREGEREEKMEKIRKKSLQKWEGTKENTERATESRVRARQEQKKGESKDKSERVRWHIFRRKT